MKQSFTLKSFLVILFLLSGLHLQAELSKEIYVETAGTISSYISNEEKDLITNLTVTGQLNGTDIRYIREMAGRDWNGKQTSGQLVVLDILDVNIVEGLDYYFYYSPSAYTYYLYTSLDNKIGDYMFLDTRLTSIKLPKSVTTIGPSVFRGCSNLTTATIGTGVTTIGAYAFSSCANLKEIYNNNTTPQPIELTVFRYTNKSKMTLYVPIGAKSSYLEAPEWKDFGSIIEVDITSTNQPQADVVEAYTEGETIVVEGVQSGEIISIYTQAGAIIQTIKATEDRVKINLPINTIYLVKTADRTFKVAL